MPLRVTMGTRLNIQAKCSQATVCNLAYSYYGEDKQSGLNLEGKDILLFLF